MDAAFTAVGRERGHGVVTLCGSVPVHLCCSSSTPSTEQEGLRGAVTLLARNRIETWEQYVLVIGVQAVT